MKVMYQAKYKRNGSNIQEIRIKDVTKKEAKEIRQRFFQTYAKVEMAPFEVYEDRIIPNVKPIAQYKGYTFYIWLESEKEKETTTMTILVDIDGVLNDMQAKLLKEINNAYKTDFKIEDLAYWEWLNDIAKDPRVNEPVWWLTEREWFWDFVQINRNAVETIESWIKQGHKVRFVTASYFCDALSHKIRTTLEAFDPNLVNERNVIIAQDKSMIRGDVMIDDHVDNLKDFNGLRICYAHPWNAHCGDMERTADWNVIDELIQNLTYGE